MSSGTQENWIDFEFDAPCDNDNSSAMNNSDINDIVVDLTSDSHSESRSNCSACFMLSPHSQLFVCTKKNCDFCLKQTIPVQSPSLFYRREHVFCGACAFRGCHSSHKKYMKQADSLAFKIASTEIGDKMEIEYEQVIQLREENTVDYTIIRVNGNEKLKKIPIIDFLTTSGTVFEWHRRLLLLNETRLNFEKQRETGHVFARDQAHKLLMAYSKISKVVRKEMIEQPKKIDLTKNMRTEHRRQIGSAHSNASGFSPLSSLSSSSWISGICSGLTAASVFDDNQKQSLQTIDDGVTGRRTIETNKKDGDSSSEEDFVEEDLSQTIAEISRRFESLLRKKNVDMAVSTMALALNARIGSSENKNAAIDFMEKMYSIVWPSQV